MRTRHTIATFKNSHDLSVSVAADLSRTAQALEEAVKAEEAEKEEPSTSLFEEINEIIKTL